MNKHCINCNSCVTRLQYLNATGLKLDPRVLFVCYFQDGGRTIDYHEDHVKKYSKNLGGLDHLVHQH